MTAPADRQPSAGPLADFVASLRAARPDCAVPDFDPEDGGATARILFLLEKPGPRMAGAGSGAGLVSRDNASGTSRAIARFMDEAGIPRRDSVLWNVVPWWNGTARIRAEEHRAGLAALAELLPLLPCLRAAVTVGRRAEAARPLLEARGLLVGHSAHPSPQVRASRPELWAAIPGRWRAAALQAGVIGGAAQARSSRRA